MKELNDSRWGWYYDDLIESMEVEKLLTESIGDYQGDMFTLLRDGGRFGFLVSGYGSCSGCDALEAAGSSRSAATELRDDLWNNIHWEGSAADMAAYLEAKDPKLEWYGSYGIETKKFYTDAISLLRERVGQSGYELAS